MNYEFNLLHLVGVVAKRLRAAAAEMAAETHEGDDNTPSGPAGRGVKTVYFVQALCHDNYFECNPTNGSDVAFTSFLIKPQEAGRFVYSQ